MVLPPPAKLALWCLLGLPAAVILFQHRGGAAAADAIAVTGEWSARLIIVALMLTPLAQLVPGNSVVRWLLRRRRAFGVAAFAYAVLHLGFYALEMETVAAMIAELGAPAIWSAWLALLGLLLPALASNDAAMRRLGARWKTIQRLAYPAALFTLAHWLLVHDGFIEALLHFAPLAALQTARLVRRHSPRPLERTLV